MTTGFPRFRAVADQAILVEFGTVITDAARAQVRSLDQKLARHPIAGFREAVPAYVNLLVVFDALLTDHAAVKHALAALLQDPDLSSKPGREHRVDVCYDADIAPDLAEVASRVNLSPDAVIAAHLGQTYHVIMYGFAPGYAYLGGVPPSLALPRKPSARRGVAAGSVIIAASQCLITTLIMPTGWWIIGRSPTPVLLDDPARPFLFDVGDTVRFRRISRAQLDATGRPA